MTSFCAGTPVLKFVPGDPELTYTSPTTAGSAACNSETREPASSRIRAAVNHGFAIIVLLWLRISVPQEIPLAHSVAHERRGGSAVGEGGLQPGVRVGGAGTHRYVVAALDLDSDQVANRAGWRPLRAVDHDVHPGERAGMRQRHRRPSPR